MQRHEPDALALLFGATFLVAGVLLLGGDPARGSVSLAWVGPIAAIVVAVLIVLAVRGPRAPGDAEGRD
jgi:uncharacterized membrane protein HdeD (DUF308 family)